MSERIAFVLLTVGLLFLAYPLWVRLLSMILAPVVVREAEQIVRESHE